MPVCFSSMLFFFFIKKIYIYISTLWWRIYVVHAALQAKTVYSWEHLSPDGLALNSKWNEAEKYICNPLSGEVPLECLSAKTLSARSFRNLASRITMSAPLIYPTHSRQYQTKPAITIHEDEVQIQFQGSKFMFLLPTRSIRIASLLIWPVSMTLLFQN